jgi:hypothetical protein
MAYTPQDKADAGAKKHALDSIAYSLDLIAGHLAKLVAIADVSRDHSGKITDSLAAISNATTVLARK